MMNKQITHTEFIERLLNLREREMLKGMNLLTTDEILKDKENNRAGKQKETICQD